MDNITVVDLAAEAVLQGEKAAFILLLDYIHDMYMYTHVHVPYTITIKKKQRLLVASI